MDDNFNLNRFIEAQSSSYEGALSSFKASYECALSELKNGRKRSHWMWYIFPQLKGLGRSLTSQFYGLSGIEEASEYLKHPILGQRLREVSTTILNLPTNDAYEVFGSIDRHKLRSSMTLFDLVSPDDVFARVLHKYFSGKRDFRTLKLILQA